MNYFNTYSHGKKRKVNYSGGYRATFQAIAGKKRKKSASVKYARNVFLSHYLNNDNRLLMK